MGIKQNIKRTDALMKATGQAKFVEDLIPRDALHVKMVHSSIANGVVKRIDYQKALLMPGVEMIITCFDVPKHNYPTAGHPPLLEEGTGDVRDKLILEERVRFYGDDIAAVVADTPLHAQLAAEQVLVEYEEYVPMLTPESSVNNQCVLHKEFSNNELARLDFTIDGDGNTNFYSGEFSNSDDISNRPDMVGDHYYVPAVHACHMENNGCIAYMEGPKIVIISCNQVPYALRRNVAEALGIPVGSVKVIKPFLGGGFGNKQDTMYEPLAALISQRLGGRPVSIQLCREETFVNTRTRHAFDLNMFTEVDDNGSILRKALRINANGGAYSGHVHAVAGYAITNNFETYLTKGEQIGESSTAYTNLPSAAAVRGYGIPQLAFAMESQMDDIALAHGWDPIDFRMKNAMPEHFIDPFAKFEVRSNGGRACMQKAREISEWDEKRRAYDEFNKNSKDRKKGIGMAFFSYKTSVYPLQVENGACRIVMNEDGTATIQVGATELGQGSDTVLCQMVSEVTSIPESRLTIVSTQDTDISPYDNGAYASRQTFVSGGAVKQAAEILCDKLVKHAARLKNISPEGLHIQNEKIVLPDGKELISIADVCRQMNFINDPKIKTEHITAESTFTADNQFFCYGVSVIDLEIDVPLGKVYINKVYAVHDSGQIINPQLAAAQIHGGVGMGIGYGLGEQMLFDQKSGRPLNNNLLDYKIPTSMDIPDIEVAFIETYEPSSPFGNKGLAEPPIIPQAPAIRNAILHATNVGIYALPMNPQNLVHAFRKAGLINN